MSNHYSYTVTRSAEYLEWVGLCAEFPSVNTDLNLIQRIAGLYRIEQEARAMTAPDRLHSRQLRAKPLWEELQVWMKLERTRVADGSGIAAALDYGLNRWSALGRFLHDGEVTRRGARRWDCAGS